MRPILCYGCMLWAPKTETESDTGTETSLCMHQTGGELDAYHSVRNIAVATMYKPLYQTRGRLGGGEAVQEQALGCRRKQSRPRKATKRPKKATPRSGDAL